MPREIESFGGEPFTPGVTLRQGRQTLGATTRPEGLACYNRAIPPAPIVIGQWKESKSLSQRDPPMAQLKSAIPKKDLFISHSSKDSKIAMEICRRLETEGITCFIAPRDMMPGNWPQQLTRAITSSKAFLLVLSKHANKSGVVRNEVISAGNRDKPMFVFAIQNVEPAPGIELCLASAHRISAHEEPLGIALEPAVAYLRNVLGFGATAAQNPIPTIPPLRAGALNLDTRTYPLFIPYTDNVSPEDVKLLLRHKQVKLPREQQKLIEEAYRTSLYPHGARIPGGVHQYSDQDCLAPRVIKRMTDMEDHERYEIEFATSSYRPYLALAAARELAARNPRFKPLADFANAPPDQLLQPSRAAVSMGVRVLVATVDQQLLVSFRHPDKVKMNPNCWSVSANEGLRLEPYQQHLRETGNPPTIQFFAEQAMKQELGFTPQEADAAHGFHSRVLSIYVNTYSQWGIGVMIQFTALGVADLQKLLEERRPLRNHRFEHTKFTFLPGNSIENFATGLAYRHQREPENLWDRWYGGALETICAYFRWLRLGDYEEQGASTPEEQLQLVCTELDRHLQHCGILLKPQDEPKREIFR